MTNKNSRRRQLRAMRFGRGVLPNGDTRQPLRSRLQRKYRKPKVGRWK